LLSYRVIFVIIATYFCYHQFIFVIIGRIFVIMRGRPKRLLTVLGVEASIREFAEAYGISENVIRQRLYKGWSEEKAVITPIDVRKRKKPKETPPDPPSSPNNPKVAKFKELMSIYSK
jgi:hypothetical protein